MTEIEKKTMDMEDVYIRVRRTDAGTIATVRTSERWRELCLRRSNVTMPFARAADTDVVAHVPSGHGLDGWRRIAYIVSAEPVDVLLTDPVRLESLRTGMSEIRSEVLSVVEQYLRPVDITMSIRSRIGPAPEGVSDA